MSSSEEVLSDSDSISASARQEIDHWIAKYPPEHKRSAVMAALHIVQEENGGWLTNGLIRAVADYLDMEPIAVYEIATFYSMYELKPVGRHKICVCNSISCMLNGSEELVAHLQKKLGVGLNEPTDDGRFSIKKVECLGACVGAPVVMIGRNYYEALTPEKLEELLDELE